MGRGWGSGRRAGGCGLGAGLARLPWLVLGHSWHSHWSTAATARPPCSCTHHLALGAHAVPPPRCCCPQEGEGSEAEEADPKAAAKLAGRRASAAALRQGVLLNFADPGLEARFRREQARGLFKVRRRGQLAGGRGLQGPARLRTPCPPARPAANSAANSAVGEGIW